MTSRTAHWIYPLFGLCIILSLLLMPATALAQGNNPQPAGGYYYVVQRGDTLSAIAWHTGIPLADLKAANPTALHPYDWLWIGDRLFIPAQPAIPSSQQSNAQPTGYWYQVKLGDNWQSVSRETGVPVLDLWHANPAHMHPNHWLYAGHWLWIPSANAQPILNVTSTPVSVATEAPATPQETATPTFVPTATATQPAPTSTPTATATQPAPTATETQPVPTSTPTATETQPAPTSTPTATTTQPAPTSTPTATETQPAPTATPTATATQPAPTPTATAAAPGPKPTPGAMTQPGEGINCPPGFADYPDAIVAHLNSAGSNLTDLEAWLTGCGVIDGTQGSVNEVAIQGPISADVVIVLRDPAPDQVVPRGLLLIFHSGPGGYTLARKVEGAGAITLLQTGDINADDQVDIAWSDTTCGAHTCFATLFVDSWDGKAYQDWIEDEPTMADPEYTFSDTVPGGSGYEILAHGGIIGSVGAGPQRAWTETYVSPEGGPYQLFNKVYDESACLYHHILDANQVFDNWTTAGFEPAIAAYQAAIADQTLEACGTIPDELHTLRDFARFRLMISQVSNGKASQAAPIKTQITTPALLGAANTFMGSYELTSSIVQACRDTTVYAKAHPDSWQFLADWGYANPSFTAEELCPLD